MPVVPNAVPHLVKSGTNNDKRKTVFGTPQIRLNYTQAWKVAWLGAPPLTQQASTPSTYTFLSQDNELIDPWATDGTNIGLWEHTDVFIKRGTYGNE